MCEELATSDSGDSGICVNLNLKMKRLGGIC